MTYTFAALFWFLLYNNQRMPLTKTTKQQIITDFQLGKNDTGSVEVQTALLSARIKQLSQHLKEHLKDNHSRRGLLHLVNKRRRLLRYLMSMDQARYKKLIKKLGLKK